MAQGVENPGAGSAGRSSAVSTSILRLDGERLGRKILMMVGAVRHRQGSSRKITVAGVTTVTVRSGGRISVLSRENAKAVSARRFMSVHRTSARRGRRLDRCDSRNSLF